MILISPYISFQINLDAPPERPFIQKALVKRLLGVRSGGRLAQARARPPSVAVPQLAGQRQANCDQGVLARAAGRSGGRSQLVGRFCQALGAECATGALSQGARGRDETPGPERIWSDHHRLPNRPR